MSEWLIDYNHPVDMDRKYYFHWRPAYLNVEMLHKPIAAEIGVLESFNTKFATKYIDFGKYYLIDPYQEYSDNDIGELDHYKQSDWDNFYQRTKDKFKDKPEIEFVRKTSKEASKQFPDNYFDFVYIDANHLYEAVWEDINLWFPKVKNGGFIAGHDVQFGDVKSAVYRFFLETYGENPSKEFVEETVDTGYNDWWIRKV